MGTRYPRFIATSLCTAGVILAFASGAFDAQTRSAPASKPAPKPANVLAMDVFAQDAVVDLLLFEETATGRELRHRRSRDGAQTWSMPVTIDRRGRGIVNHHRGMDPQIASVGDSIVVLWTLPGSSKWGEGTLATAVSRDGGRTWASGPNPADDGTNGGHAFLDLAADANGTFTAFWLDSRDGAQGLRVAVSRDAARTWAPNASIDTRTCECCWNKAAALGPDSFAVLYRDKDPRDMALALTADSGRTWTRTAAVGDFKWNIEACPHIGGALAHTTLAGESRLHALVFSGAEGREGLHWLASRDAGRSWSGPTRLGSIAAKHGDLAASQSDVAAVWDDMRRDKRVILAATTADEGKTWQVPVQLSSAESSASHPLVLWTRGRFVAFWTEKSSGGPTEWRSRSIASANKERRVSRIRRPTAEQSTLRVE